MKRTLFSNVLLASLMIFATACGKDGKKKSNNDFYAYNPYVSGGAYTGQQAVTNLQKYLNAKETKSTPNGLTAVPVVYAVQEGNGCSEKKFLGIPYTICTYNNKIKYESETLYVPANQVRSTYEGLSQIMNPVYPAVLVAVYQNGQNFDVYHAIQGSSTQKLVRYTINTNTHAGLNPVRIENADTKTIKELSCTNCF